MLMPGDRVVAGISGGADSVCLLFLLLEWAKTVPLELAVVHINHGIRREAAADAAFVKGLCEAHGLTFYLTESDVRTRAEQEKCSEEDAGRRTRYEAFARAAEEFGATKIAVAHNCNDRSETMLFHLFRGSGIKGLGSIQPVRDNIIRPILCLERQEIEEYLKISDITYCQDATNASDDYTRNRIRHHIIPYAQENIVQGCVSHMAQTAELLSETENYLEQQTKIAMKACVVQRKEKLYEIAVASLLEEHPLLQKRILHQLVKSLSPHQKDISYIHIVDLLELFTGEGNRSVNLPFGIQGKREYDKVLLGIVEREEILSDDFEMELTVIDMKDFDKNYRELPPNEYTKWFDYDKIKGCLALRNREIGDYLTIAGDAGGIHRKSVKDYMITAKIPRDRRDKLFLLAEGNHVLWLVGYRISEYYKISENTKRILQVQLTPKNEKV